MKIQKVRLVQFKRFDDLTIDLGENPKKIIALVGPNGCGKSSIFDAFEEKLKDFRHSGNEDITFFSKSLFYKDISLPKITYNRVQSIVINTCNNQQLDRKSFYIRTAYRFTARIHVNTIEAQQSILDTRDEPHSSIVLDTRLQNNYKRLIGEAYSAFDVQGTKTGNEIKDELLGKINKILSNILDVKISSLGNILANKGQLYFEKENVTNFPYANLSSGEKEVIDIIIDLVIKSTIYNDTVFCIDEPELHLSTAIQRKLLVEIEKLIPDNCQLWVATHSIGFLRSLQEELKDKSQILDFSEKDYFSGPQTITPIRPNRKNWQRIFKTALEDLTGLIAPKRIIYCEGKLNDKRAHIEEGLDAKVFNEIFGDAYSDTIFISSGGNTELDHRADVAIAILGKVFSEVDIWILKDRDMNSGKVIDEPGRQLYLKNNAESHRVLKRFEIENYIFDKEILKKYCLANGLEFNEDKYDRCFVNVIDDNVKDQINTIKACCNVPGSVNAEKFKLNLSVFITPDTQVYQELADCIFNRN